MCMINMFLKNGWRLKEEGSLPKSITNFTKKTKKYNNYAYSPLF